jgi:DnaJ-class molecular chaperone
MRLIVRQIGPGMVQQTQMMCPDCNGKGINKYNYIYILLLFF